VRPRLPVQPWDLGLVDVQLNRCRSHKKQRHTHAHALSAPAPALRLTLHTRLSDGVAVEQQPCHRGTHANRGGNNDTGMYRTASRLGANSGRCHWLLPPESLSLRVDPKTSEFLQRQWLALAQIKTAKSALPCSDAANSTSLRMRPRRGRGRSYPAQLHAGWLAQTLRPRGWLAVIPEDEQKNLPMPVDLVSEPDRGPRRPCAAAVERVILQELGLGKGR